MKVVPNRRLRIAGPGGRPVPLPPSASKNVAGWLVQAPCPYCEDDGASLYGSLESDGWFRCAYYHQWQEECPKCGSVVVPGGEGPVCERRGHIQQ